MTSFDTKDYWETRLSADYSLHGVGRLNWGLHYNKWLYRVRRSVFLRLVRSLADDLGNADVLDVGSGTGFYIERWKELRPRTVTGADLTDVAVEKLRERFPDDTFHRINVGEDVSPLGGRQYDLISCMDVMFHIVDDQQYENALGNVFTLLKPGGTFIFSDLFMHGETRRSSYIVHRTLEMIESFCAKTGFEIVKRCPMFVLMNEPLDTSNKLLKLYWAALTRIVPRFQPSGQIFGAALYPLEMALVSMRDESPATEIMVCRKPTR